MISNKKFKHFNKKFDVVSLFIIVKGKILLLKRRSGKSQAGLWGPPAGKVDKGESLQRAILRETYEEVGINIQETELRHFKKEYFVRHKRTDFIFHVFAIYRDDFINVNINGIEHVEYGWFDMQEALKMDLIENEEIPLKDYFNLH